MGWNVDGRGKQMTGGKKRRAAIPVEGHDRAAIENDDPSIPVNELHSLRQVLALLKVIEECFPDSKHRMVEFGVYERIITPESEVILNRILAAQDTSGAQLGAWFPRREQAVITNFKHYFRKAVRSWQRIARPLRENYDAQASSDERVAGDNLTETLFRLASFFEDARPAVMEAVAQTSANSSDRERWGVIMVVHECRYFWTEQKGKPPAMVATADTPWWNFLVKVFDALKLNVAPETATKAWKRQREQIRASEERGGRIGPEIIVIVPVKSVP
jgi:hypothetical protein